jgi:hypothetical protein
VQPVAEGQESALVEVGRDLVMTVEQYARQDLSAGEIPGDTLQVNVLYKDIYGADLNSVLSLRLVPGAAGWSRPFSTG